MAAGIRKVGNAYDTEWYREEVMKAERGNREHLARHDRSFYGCLAKLADDERERDDDGGGVNDHHISRLADLVAEGSGGKVDRAAALGWLLHHRDGIALARTHKAKESSMESIEKLKAARVEKLEQLAKSSGAVAVAKHVLAEGPSGITKADFNRMCNADWQRDRRSGESYDQCFSRHYIAPEARDVRKADQMRSQRYIELAVSAGRKPVRRFVLRARSRQILILQSRRMSAPLPRRFTNFLARNQ
jgi:hypothetical protein